MPTTQISLIRRHTEVIEPPRALWVPFELGRPLGVPNDPPFQQRVLLAALALLEAPSGPVLQDFPEDAPASAEEITMLACPIGFVQNEVDLTETEKLCAAFKSEMASLRPWYDRTVAKRGRTTVGVSRIDQDSLSAFICSFLESDEPQNPRDDIPLAYTLSLAANDTKAYYFEGITAQPGQESPSSQVFTDWFWRETAAGKVLLTIRKRYEQSEDSMMRRIGRGLIVPGKVATALAR